MKKHTTQRITLWAKFRYNARFYLTDNFMSSYQYPNANQVYPDRVGKSQASKRFRYNLRSWLHRTNVQRFEQFINQHANLVAFLNPRPNFSYPVVYRFLDKRFNAKQRLQHVCDNLQFLPERLQSLGAPSVLTQDIHLSDVGDDFELRLVVNGFQPMEGFWNLELFYKPTNELIYLLTFGKVHDALLIAVVQGPNQEGAKEFVKTLTKKCHGLRPAYLMVETMKILTRLLGYPRLFGIPQKYQNKSRFIKSTQFKVNYDAIFGESQGTLSDYWDLPLTSDRDLSHIASKKRSMYRKRYAMLDDIEQNMQKNLNIHP